MDLGRLIGRRSEGDDSDAHDARARRLGFGMRRRRGWLTGAALLSGFLAVPLVWGNGVLPVDVPLLDSVAWLPSDGSREVARVNGETGEVDATLPVPGDGSISVEQTDGVALVEVGGVVRHIDVAQLDWGDDGRGRPVDGQVVVGDGAAYLVQPDTGVVRALNPETLTPSAPVDLEVTFQGPGLLVAGYLVVPGSDGELHVFGGGRHVGSTPVGVQGNILAVSHVGDEVVALNITAGRLSRFTVDGGRLRPRGEVDVAGLTSDLVVPPHLPAGKLWVVAPRSGLLVGIDLESGDTTSVEVVEPGSAKQDVSGPVVAHGRVYVMDRVDGRIVEVDAATTEVISDDEMGVDDASRVDVVVQGDTVFVNDRGGSTAVVIDGDDRHQVDKDEHTGPDDGDDDQQPDSSGGTGPTTGPGDPPGNPGGDPPGPTDPGGGGEGPLPSLPAGPSPTPPSSSTTTAPTTTTTRPTPPGQVVNLQVAEGDGGVQLSWQPPATGTGPFTYTVSWTPGGAQRPVGGTTYDATGLTNGVTYRFTVTARNAAGAGPAAQQDGTPRAPITPPTVDSAFAYEQNGLDTGNPFAVDFDYSGGGAPDVTCYAEKTGQPATRLFGSCGPGDGSTTIGGFTLEQGECTGFTAGISTSAGSAESSTVSDCLEGPAPTTPVETTPTSVDLSPCIIDGTTIEECVGPLGQGGTDVGGAATTECRFWAVDPQTGDMVCVG